MIKKFEELLNEDYFSKLSSRKDNDEVRKEDNNDGIIAYTVSNAGQMSALCHVLNKTAEIQFDDNIQFGIFKTEKEAQDAADKLNGYFKGVQGNIFYVESIRKYTFEGVVEDIISKTAF